MIKKIIIVASVISLITFAACTKDRTCNCTITRTGTSTTQGKVEAALLPGFPAISLADTTFTQDVYNIQIVDKKMTKVTKKAAQSNCINYSQPYNETTITSVPASSFNLSVVITDKGTEKFDCTLK